ncbi:hypothetical protein CHS0354_014160 [Potamilus streckersoni]|uniref:RNA helicase n=1 Tax=Potamilus streckersoni TaxID=2493646 RepID=A0AAE0VZG3_9BIVA|nr:hypothetical protein CHS0354_014160 [Potamilus streckersoni]
MDNDSLNWFRFANCLVNIGNEVLQKLLHFHIKTCSFRAYHDFWLEKVTADNCISDDLNVLYNSFSQQCSTLDAASQQTLQQLLLKWKQKLPKMKLRRQLFFLERWEKDLQDTLSNNTALQVTLSKWSNEIKELVMEHSSMLAIVRNWTKDFIDLCHVNQLDLFHLIEEHNKRTQSLWLAFRQDLRDPANALSTCQQNEQSSFYTLKRSLNTFFISWQPKIDELIDPWLENIPKCLNQKILNSLLTDVKKGLPTVHKDCQVKINDIGETWHKYVQQKLTKWNKKLQRVGKSPVDLQDLGRKWHDRCMVFPSVSDIQIIDFISSKSADLKKLEKSHALTAPQKSLLNPPQGVFNIQAFDITLVSSLLRNICIALQPEFDSSDKLLESDLSLSADLMRLTRIRNNNFGHISHPALNTSEFELIWAELEAILCRLSMLLGDEFCHEVQQKITEIKTCSFDARMEIKLQLDFLNWYKSNLLLFDKATEEKFESCLASLQTLNKKVQDLPQQQVILMSEIQDIKTMIQAMSQEFTMQRLERIEQRVAKMEEHISNSGGPDTSISDHASPSSSNHRHDEASDLDVISRREKVDNIDSDGRLYIAKDEDADSRQSESENELASDFESSDEDTSDWQQMAHIDHPLQLRNYQLELAEDALRGENTIICAETGSGKTWVALYIAKNHLESASPRKKFVVFMARTNPLIRQQYQRFVKYLPRHRTKLVTADLEESMKLHMFLPDYDIICFTPQILVNNLEKQTVSLSDFSLMILDECHHTKKDEAYNRLMRKYLMAKIKNKVQNLPQIVGMTASIGVGKSTSDDEAVDYIISVMANLDTFKLSTVERCREEIEKYISQPKEGMHMIMPMKDRFGDLCKKRLLDAMNDVQEKLQEACLLEESMLEIVSSKRPEDLKLQQYTQWARTVEKMAASQVLNPETARLIISCVKYLVTFNEALELNSLLGILDVCKFLARKFNPEKEHQSKLTQEEKELLQLILKVQKDLSGYDKSKFQMNPNLQTLSNTLQELLLAENADPESRALVFVKARATCTALAHYLDGVLGKDNLHVYKLTGKGGDDGMTEAEQTDTLAKFKSGEYKVLVSTSVGGEGIDIPDCNIVLSYNYAGNEITKIQMAGRGRKKGGKNIVMGYEKMLDVEKLNTYKAAMMYRAMKAIKKIDPKTLQQKISLLQKNETHKQELHDRNLQKQICMKRKGQFRLCCYKCATVATDGENLRVLRDTFHIVIDKEFRNLIDVRPHKKPTKKKIAGLLSSDKIYCKNCGMDWGVYYVYDKIPLPAIKIRSFKILSDDGKSLFFKKWLDLPFELEACELSDLMNLLEE